MNVENEKTIKNVLNIYLSNQSHITIFLLLAEPLNVNTGFPCFL